MWASDLCLPGARRGKVRDLYRLPDGPDGPRVLIVASDRISAFDVVLPTPIPGKGRILTSLAAFWLRFIESRGLSRTHLLPGGAEQVPEEAFAGTRTRREDLEGRVTVARACRVIPVECVARGYLEGSGWKEYQATGRVCGIALPPGLRQCDRLAEPIFTPATKEEQGTHDQNIDFDEACRRVGGPLMERLRDATMAIYRAASAHALERGIIIADTKLEFGIPLGPFPDDSDVPIVIDEALTPDSSRFWPANEWRPGGPQRSYDKQFLREHLMALRARGEWDMSPPGPALPAEVVEATGARYEEAARRLMGSAPARTGS